MNPANKDRNETKRRLTDPAQSFTEDELQRLIDAEFSDQSDDMDTALIDLATARLLMMKGTPVTEPNLLAAEQANVQRVLRDVLQLPKK